jgi:hypothetical protein
MNRIKGLDAISSRLTGEKLSGLSFPLPFLQIHQSDWMDSSKSWSKRIRLLAASID